MDKVLILHSNLRGSDRLVAKFKSSFPSLEAIPILFFDRDKEGQFISCQVVTPKNLRRFTKSFDFTDVIAIQVSFMTTSKVYFIRHAPRRIKIVWGIPGGDLYNRYLRYFGYPLFFSEKKSMKYHIGYALRRVFRRFEFNYIVNRCDAVISAYCDYSLICKYAGKHSSVPFHVYSIAYPMDKMLGRYFNHPFVFSDSIHVIVGNSASRTNNHLYALEFLKRLKRDDFNVQLILSYGDSDQQYRRTVKDYYLSAFHDRVSFVTDYMAMDEFNHMLLSATHFVYGNWRQEAVGNILTALYFGGKVFLSTKNPLLADLKMKGFFIYSLEEIDSSFFIPLPLDYKYHNRDLVISSYNSDRANRLFYEGLCSLYEK